MILDNTYQPYFKKIWILENKCNNNQNKTGPMVGDGCFELIFVYGKGYWTFLDGIATLIPEGIYLGGHITKPFEMQMLPNTKIFFVKMYPWTARLLAQFNFGQCINTTIELKHINKPLFEKLSKNYFNNDISQILQILGKQIESNLVTNNDYKVIQYSTQLLSKHYLDFKKAKSILLQETRFSAKTIETKFKLNFGLTPKKFTNTIRFRNIAEEIYHSKSILHLTTLAYDHGYFDQAHFIRECQKNLGINPRQLRPKNCFLTDSKESFRYYTI